MALVVDRKQAKAFIFKDGAEVERTVFKGLPVPQKVKHGDDTWDAQDKIYRHIENHLHLHLEQISKQAIDFAKKHHVTRIIIGGHKPLFPKVKEHIPYPYSRKVKGYFVTELKAPLGEILKRVKKQINTLEAKDKKGDSHAGKKTAA